MPPTQINNTWGQNAAEGLSTKVTCPSGNEVVAKRMGMQSLLATGAFGEADSLTSFVDKKHVKRVRGGNGVQDHDEVDPRSLLSDPEALSKVVMVVDRSMPYIIEQPAVHLHLTDNEDGTTTKLSPEDRETINANADVVYVYTDQIPFEDKMHIFNWAVGGTANAERFLQEAQSDLGDVAAGEGVQRPTKRSRRNRRHG